MTRPPRYVIDLEKQFPTLPNAPIVEAVIQINATLIVGIDVAKTEATVFEDLDKSLNEIRILKNSVFFAFMKDAESKFS